MNQTSFSPAARWIWHPGGEGVNQYVDFIRRFALPATPRQATFRVAVDSDYQLWINGAAMPGRQFPCYPEERVFNTCDVTSFLRRGRNMIAILACFRGVDSFEYRLGRAGLIAQLDVDGRIIVSNAGWDCRMDPVFRSGEMPRTTLQMGFTVQADARNDDGWRESPGSAAGGWRAASELATPTGGYWKTLRERPLPADSRMEIARASLIARGEVTRPPAGDVLKRVISSRFNLPEQMEAGESASPAQLMMQDFRRTVRVSQPAEAPWSLDFPARPERGIFALFDLGGEQFGEFRLVVDAPGGAVIDVAHGEHLEDIGVRAFVGGRHFADRFICRSGRNDLTIPFRRIGARYLQLHVAGPAEKCPPLVIHEAGVRPREYAGALRAAYSSADRLMEAVRDVSVRTLRFGMAEHFSDCPWREQSLYAFDCRNSALFNYYTFGDYGFAGESLRLLGMGLREDGLLELCAPARVPVTIPIFSLAWIAALRDHYLFSGQPAIFREFEFVIRRILEAFLARPDAATGLYRLFIGDEFWTCYEWAPGLDFKNGHSFGDDGKFRLDAPHNLHLIEAFGAFADLLEYEGRMAEAGGWRKRARGLGRAVRKFFWDERRQLFASFGDRRRRWHYCATTQAQAIVTGVAAARERVRLRARLLENGASGTSADRRTPWIGMTLSTRLYGLRAMIGAPEDVQRAVYKDLMKVFGEMVLKGADTLWETVRGADDFDFAGSLCHAWSASPLWFTQAYVLGIEPLTPGFKRFRARPHPSGLPDADGIVPTPGGPIRISWKRKGPGIAVNLKTPKGLVREA